MLAFPNAKINIGLYVVEKRTDGYHNIESIMYPIHKLKDALEIVPSNEFGFFIHGKAIDGDVKDNLCMKALHLLGLAESDMHVHLLKSIPMGAGLGGGSADASTLLMLADAFLNLNNSKTVLKTLASFLGSDCSFFIDNQPVLCTGKGEITSPVALDLSKYHIQLVHPNIHISTAEAYKLVEIKYPETDLESALLYPIEDWKHHIFNSFEQGAFSLFPEIGRIKDRMYQEGALYASMSGSGSAVYGIFNTQKQIPWPTTYSQYWV